MLSKCGEWTLFVVVVVVVDLNFSLDDKCKENEEEQNDQKCKENMICNGI